MYYYYFKNSFSETCRNLDVEEGIKLNTNIYETDYNFLSHFK